MSYYPNMDEDEDASNEVQFTKAQFEAARFIVARLRAEAAGEPFDIEQAGYTWNPDDPVVMMSEHGTMIHGTDLLQACLVLLWGFIETDDPILAASTVSIMGLSIAMADPDDLDGQDL